MHEIEKTWTAHGLQCVALRVLPGYTPGPGMQSSWLCGYVAVPKDHPLYGADYSEHSEALAAMWEGAKQCEIGKRGLLALMANAYSDEARPDCVFNVHGGLTYSGKDYPVKGDGLWWFGFDCNHCDDYDVPLPYVEGECDDLARQLAELTGGDNAADNQ